MTPKLTKSASEFELGPEARGALEKPRDASVDPVEHAADDDGDHRRLVAPLIGQPDRGQPEAQRDQGDDVGDDRPDRNRLEQAPVAVRPDRARRAGTGRSWRNTRAALLGGSTELPDAGTGAPVPRASGRPSTVSPATAVWPRPTSTRVARAAGRCRAASRSGSGRSARRRQLSPVLTKDTMRRATRPAICTTPILAAVALDHEARCARCPRSPCRVRR